MATTVDFTMYTGDKRILELTVKDVAAAIVDLSGASGSDIHWILQRALGDNADQVYKELASGITFKTDGTDGIVQVAIDEADTQDFDAVNDLAYPHQLSVEVSARPAISMAGTVTIKQRIYQDVDQEVAGVVIDVTMGFTAGTVNTA